MHRFLLILALVLGCDASLHSNTLQNKPIIESVETGYIPFTLRQTNFGVFIEFDLSEEELKALRWHIHP